MKTVLAFGSFDILHPGHLYYLEEAKRHGDRLIVIVARDESIRKLKGHEPKYNQHERLEHVRALSYVDKAVLGQSIEDPYEIVEDINPDVICFGYDQKTFATDVKAELKKRGLKADVVTIGPFREHEFKSSKLKEKFR